MVLQPGRLVFATEDEFAAAMCFVDDIPMEKVSLVLLDWKWGAAASSFDQYEITGEGKRYIVTCGARARERGGGRGALEPEFDGLLMLEDLSTRSRPRHAASRVPEFLEDEHDFMADVIREIEDASDVVAQALPEERSDAEDLPDQEGEGVDPEGGEQDEPAQAPPFPVEAQPAPAHPPQPARRELQAARLIYDRGGWDFAAVASRATVGRIHHLGSTSLKATCKIHKSCTCAVSLPQMGTPRHDQVTLALAHPPTFEDVERDLKEWLAEGLSCDSERHTQSSVQLKSERWRMQIRRR